MSITLYEFHKVANIFPMMTDTEFGELKKSISQNGQRDPIIIYENKIVDGRNRYNACLELGVEPKAIEWDGEGSLVGFVMDKNLNRRQLTQSQRSAVGAESVPMIAEESKLRMIATQNNKTGKQTREQLSSTDASRDGRTSHIAGEMVGVSRASVERATKVMKDGIPELFGALKVGDISVMSSYEIAKLPKPEQQQALEEHKQGIKQQRQTKAEKDEVNRQNSEWVEANKTKELTEEDLELKEIVDKALKFLTESMYELNNKTASMKDDVNFYRILRPLIHSSSKYLNDVEVIIKVGVCKND